MPIARDGRLDSLSSSRLGSRVASQNIRPALAASFVIGAVGLANNPMGDRYLHLVQEHVPIDFRSSPTTGRK